MKEKEKNLLLAKSVLPEMVEFAKRGKLGRSYFEYRVLIYIIAIILFIIIPWIVVKMFSPQNQDDVLVKCCRVIGLVTVGSLVELPLQMIRRKLNIKIMKDEEELS